MTHRGSARLLLRGAVAICVAGAGIAATAQIAGAATSNDSTQFSVSAGSLAFSSTNSPQMPTLTAVTLNGQAQTTNTTMTNFAVVDATGNGSGWNVTVDGNAGTGKSAVFKQYCPSPTNCGSDTAQSYVSSGATLAADSLTLNATGAGFTAQNGTTGTAPSYPSPCSTGCPVDTPSTAQSKVVSAATNAGMGTYQASGWAANSLVLSTPSSLKTLSNGEVYRVDLVWTLNSGP